MLRGVTATSFSITWCLLFPKWDICPKVGHSLNAKWCYFYFENLFFSVQSGTFAEWIPGRKKTFCITW